MVDEVDYMPAGPTEWSNNARFERSCCHSLLARVSTVLCLAVLAAQRHSGAIELMESALSTVLEATTLKPELWRIFTAFEIWLDEAAP
jgi:hypothetical protein